jgi:3-methyl-2-oxobutanoate hydroxymethyltransferase
MRNNVLDLFKKQKSGSKLCMITAYDAPTAQMAENAGVDAILVGDSVATTVLGMENTLTISLEQMIYHARAVVRGTQKTIIIGDMPFLSYQAGKEWALQSAGKFIQEAGVQAVKLEWCVNAFEITKFLTGNGIPVMGHVGFTPQSIYQMGGYHLQGKTEKAARQIFHQAKLFEKAGAFSVVLELMPAALSKSITMELNIPTIGIGAGEDCDGQVQVLHDLLGLLKDFHPKHAVQYLNLYELIQNAIQKYVQDVRRQKLYHQKL